MLLGFEKQGHSSQMFYKKFLEKKSQVQPAHFISPPPFSNNRSRFGVPVYVRASKMAGTYSKE
jgi:hypothetical protein